MPLNQAVPLPEQAEIVRILAEVATAGNVDYRQVASKVGIPLTMVPAVGMDPNSIWYSLVTNVHAGGSSHAGEKRIALAHLVAAVSDFLPGNAALNELVYKLGHGGQPTPGGPSIFLSYTTKDRGDVDQLYEAIRARDATISLFQDHRSILPGLDWLAVIKQHVGLSSIMVCWQTINFLQSTFVHYEIGLAESGGALIIPVVEESSIAGPIPAYLQNRQGTKTTVPHDFSSLAEKILGCAQRNRP